MNLQQYILHPELLDRGTLYELRALTARYPYYQPARLLLLKNLYLLHDSTFDEELRRAAIYVADRRKLFELVEAAHYQLRQDQEKTSEKNVLSEGTTIGKQEEETAKTDKQPATDRTTKLIDDFLEQIPHDEEKKDAEKDTTESGGKTPKPKKRRKPTVADATGDYMAYLMEVESEDEQEEETKDSPQLKGQNLIDDFLNNDDGKIELKEDPEYEPEIEDDNSDDDDDYVVHGPNRITALPMEVPVCYQEIAHCLDKTVAKIENAVLSALENTPPELYADIVKNGIYLSGGGALLRGLDKRLTDKINIPFHIAEDPLHSVAKGAGVALKNVDRFSFLMR